MQKIFLPIMAIVILITLVGAGCDTTTNQPKETQPIQNNEVEQKDVVEKKQPDTNKVEIKKEEPKKETSVKVEDTKTIKAEPEPVVVEEIKNCGTDINCLIEASKNCEPAKVSFSYSLDFMGVNFNFSDYYKIQSKNNGCNWYMKTNSVSTSYGEYQKTQLLEMGMTEEDIKEYEKAGTEKAKIDYEGKDANCLFSNNTELTKVLTEYKNNKRTTSLKNVATCSGPLLEATISGEGSTQIDISN